MFFQAQLSHDIEDIRKKLRKPGGLAKYTIAVKMQSSLVEDISVLYGGYLALSDYNGEVSFPRKHQKAVVDIIITSEIVPIPLFESTIAYWRRVPLVPAKLYRCQQGYDEKKSQYYWDTSEIPLPHDLAIPTAAIIIIAKPENIVLNEGRMFIHETANIVLPTLYVNKNINKLESSAYMLTIRHLFKPVDTKENREPLRILTHIID